MGFIEHFCPVSHLVTHLIRACCAFLPVPESLLALLCLPPFVPATNGNMKSAKDSILSFFFPFKNQHPLVFNTLSALPLPAVFVFHGASFRRGLFYCLLVCFLIYRSLLWYLQCCATFPVFNSPFKCLQAELLCIVFVLWSIDPFPSKEWCLLFVFM